MSLEDERILYRNETPAFKYRPFSVSGDLITRAKAEDQTAYTELDLAIRPRLLGYFYRRLPEEAEDLAQNTIIKIAAGLKKFRVDSERSVPYQFTSWCFKIARITFYEELIESGKRERSFVPQNPYEQDEPFDEIISGLHYQYNPHDYTFSDPSSEEDEEIEKPNIQQLLNDWFDKNLTKRQQYIVVQRATGKGNMEIGGELKLYRSTIGKEAMKIKRKIEDDLLRPANFRPLKEFRDESITGLGNKSLYSAVVCDRLKVVRVLDRVYTSPECIEKYLAGRRDNLDKAQTLNGLVYIGDHTSPGEYFSLLRNSSYRRLLNFVNGRPYIHPEDLEDIKKRRNQNPTKPTKILPPVEGCVELRSIVQTHTEYAKYKTAILAGRLEAVKERRIFWITPEAISEYNERYKIIH